MRRVLEDIEASGRRVRVLKTDGDGIFNKSTEYLGLRFYSRKDSMIIIKMRLIESVEQY